MKGWVEFWVYIYIVECEAKLQIHTLSSVNKVKA